MEKFIQRENQIGRIFRAKNPNVTIVYITPYEFDDELSKYYDKVTILFFKLFRYFN
jgi:hypothetical protein